MDKILVFGDSIAYGKWDQDGGWVARLRKYIDDKYNPVKNIQVYNLGIPGEVAIRMVERVENELVARVDPKNENLVIFCVGVNDSCPNNWMTGRQTPEAEFKEALRKIVRVAVKYKCKVIFVGLAPINPTKSKGLQFSNEEVLKYDGYISDVCTELGIRKLDLFGVLEKGNYAEKLVDSVHPSSKGHEKIFELVKQEIEQ